MDQRQYSLPGVWAKSANVQIPVPPVVGISYRNTALTQETVENGQAYKSLGDSADWNEFMLQQSGTLQACEQYGIPPYCSTTQYHSRSLALWTDGLLYRVIEGQEPPKGTPPTNTQYWEMYIPDGVQTKPDIDISQGTGMTFFVDYTKPTSGDGKSRATAFKSLTDCFNAIREKYSGVNGLFPLSSSSSSNSYTPIYTIDMYGAAQQTIESGTFVIENVNLAFVLNAAFTLTGTIRAYSSHIEIRGSGQLTVNGQLSFTSSDLITYANLTVNSVANGGSAFTLIGGLLQVETGATVNLIDTANGESTNALLAKRGSFEILGTLNLRLNGNNDPYTYVNTRLCEFYVAGTLTCDRAANSEVNTSWFSVNDTMIGPGTFAFAGISLVHGMLQPGTLQLGSANLTLRGIIASGGAYVDVAASVVSQYGSFPPNISADMRTGSVLYLYDRVLPGGAPVSSTGGAIYN